jgi:hypothetical protein
VRTKLASGFLQFFPESALGGDLGPRLSSHGTTIHRV